MLAPLGATGHFNLREVVMSAVRFLAAGGSVAAAAAAAAVLCGCTSSGLSPREVRGQDYSSFVFSSPARAEPARSVTMSPAPVPTTDSGAADVANLGPV